SGTWGGLLYDGSTETVDSGVSVTSYFSSYRVVVWATGSLLGINANNKEVTKSVSNSGYTAYNTPDLCLGNANYQGATSPVIVQLCVRSNIAWDANQRASFVNNPWQIF